MFVDRVKIEVAAGNGGNGVVAWRREKFIPKGGPAGGDGGRGGSLIIEVDPNTCSLDSFRHMRILLAEHGGQGQGSLCKGKDGKDLIIKIPPGTLVLDAASSEILFDGTAYGEQFVLCRGGKGGKGNARFKSPTNRAPNIATPGEKGERKSIELELKLIGDVGLVGFPNAGKSTLLQALANRHVKTASYPFTTLHPEVGYITMDEKQRIIITDIPGIIEGAHKGRGLGLEFLKHIERTRMLLFVLDTSCIDGRDPLSDYKTLHNELREYDPSLLKKPSIIILNKCDVEGVEEQIEHFKRHVRHPHIVTCSALNHSGLDSVKNEIIQVFSRDIMG